MKRFIISALLVLWTASAAAQWQTPSGTIPVGRGQGATGFSTVSGSGGSGAKCLLDTTPPTFGACPSSLTIGSTPIVGGTNNYLLYNNAGVLGNLTVLPSITAFLASGATTSQTFAEWASDDRYIEYFGGGIGVADNTPALNAAIAAGVSVRFRAGAAYNFTTAPNCISKTFRILGSPFTDQLTQLNRNYNEADPTRGLLCWTTGEMTVANVIIVNSATTTGGAGVSYVCATMGGCSGHLFNVRITSASNVNSWQHTLYVDGSISTSPIGIRTLYLNNVTVFGALTRAAYIRSVVHFNWNSGSINQAGGSDGSLELTGTAGAPSSENSINLDYVSGNILFDRFSNSIVKAAEVGGNVTNTANATGITGEGRVLGGTIEGNWPNSSWRNGGSLLMTKTGGDVIISRYSDTNPPIGTFIGAFSGHPAIGQNVTHSAGNSFNIAVAGDWWMLGNLSASPTYTTCISTGTGAAGASADYLTNCRLYITNTGLVTINNQLTVATNGLVSAPAIALNDADTGFYTTAGQILFTENGVNGQIFTSTQLIQQRNGGPPNIAVQRLDAHGTSASVGTYVFRGMDSTSASTIYSQFQSIATNVTDGSEAGYLSFDSTFAGTARTVFRATGTAGTHELTPNTNDGSALGSTTLSWADLFLATGGVINWNSGDVTITHAANTLAFAGAASGYSFDAVVTNTSATAATSTGTGALVLSGANAGIGVAGAGWFGTYINVVPTTVGSLGTCDASVNGARKFVTDATATTFASAVAGVGANRVPVYCDGNAGQWKIGANDNVPVYDRRKYA